MSIRQRLGLLLAVVSLVPVAVIGLIAASDHSDQRREVRLLELELEWGDLRRGFDDRLSRACYRFNDYFSGAQRVLNVNEPDTVRVQLEQFLDSEPVFDGLALFAEDGRLIDSRRLVYSLPTQVDPGFRWFQRAVNGETTLLSSLDLVGVPDRVAACFVAFPVSIPGGRVVAGVAALNLRESLHDFEMVAKSRYGILFTNDPADGTLHTWGEVSSLETTFWARFLEEIYRQSPYLDGNVRARTTPPLLAVVRRLGSFHEDSSGAATPLYMVLAIPESSAALALTGAFPLLSLGVLIAILLTVLGMKKIARELLDPLERVQEGLAHVSRGEGDLQRTLEVSGWSELADLSRHYNRFVSSLSGIIRELQGTTHEIRGEVRQVVRQNTAISRRIGREVGDIAAVSEEMNRFLRQEQHLSERIDRASDLARNGRESTLRGEEVIGSVVSSFNHILGKMREFSKQTRDLGQSVSEIHKNSKSLDHIAERSRLLALNVSIEANRSDGASGGVDVVANEIQLLSEKTIDFTNRIRTLIRRLVEESQGLIQRFEEQEDELAQGWSEQSQEANRALQTIRNANADLVEEVAEISQLNRHQAHFSAKVRRHLKETRRLINNIIYQVSRNNESVASVHRLFKELDTELGEFQVGADEFVDDDGVDPFQEVHQATRMIELQPPSPNPTSTPVSESIYLQKPEEQKS